MKYGLLTTVSLLLANHAMAATKPQPPEVAIIQCVIASSGQLQLFYVDTTVATLGGNGNPDCAGQLQAAIAIGFELQNVTNFPVTLGPGYPVYNTLTYTFVKPAVS